MKFFKPKPNQDFDFETAFSNVCARLDHVAIEQIKSWGVLKTLTAGQQTIMATQQEDHALQVAQKAAVDKLGITLAAVSTAIDKSTKDFKDWIASLQTGQPIDISFGQAALAGLDAINNTMTGLVATITANDPNAPPAIPQPN